VTTLTAAIKNEKKKKPAEHFVVKHGRGPEKKKATRKKTNKREKKTTKPLKSLQGGLLW